MTRFVHHAVSIISFLIALASACGSHWQACLAQEELIERPGPPSVDNLEVDENKDDLPDGWYNARDAKWVTEGGAPGSGPHFVRFECKDPGRPRG